MDADDPGGWIALLKRIARLVPAYPGGWPRILRTLPPPVKRRIFEEWLWQAHGGQEEPKGDWRTWLIMAGRGFGKTRAGAEWVWARARQYPGAGIALVGGSYDEVAKVMVEGPSGLLATARSGESPLWIATQGVFRFPSGAQAFVYSAEAPEKLRGPQHHFAWCDELAKWPASTSSGEARGKAAWDNLQMGLRVGDRPRAVVTTTPRTVPLMKAVLAMPAMVKTQGRTSENVHSSPAFRRWVEESYAGSRLGRQELDGELIEDLDGTLFPREVLEAARQSAPELRRIVVGVDPPASADGDSCGIVVCAMGADGIAYMLADCTVSGERPEGWARAVANAARGWGADRVVAEKNQGGDMVGSVLRGVDPGLPVRLVSASRGKVARAEPVAAAFETGRAKLAGRFPSLEDELAGLGVAGSYQGPGRSPDRADAMVWAMTELMAPRGEPSVRRL
jgi:phage terminase large subunit-like protein